MITKCRNNKYNIIINLLNWDVLYKQYVNLYNNTKNLNSF